MRRAVSLLHAASHGVVQPPVEERSHSEHARGLALGRVCGVLVFVLLFVIVLVFFVFAFAYSAARRRRSHARLSTLAIPAKYVCEL